MNRPTWCAFRGCDKLATNPGDPLPTCALHASVVNPAPPGHRHWQAERTFVDAPVHLSAEMANAWAWGWNAAVRAALADHREGP